MKKIIETARKEIEQEQFREEVDKYKHKLRNQKTIWDRLFPWKIIIVRKDEK